MVKDHSDSEKGNPLPPISSKGSFIYTIPDRIAHTTAFVTPVVEHWLEWEIAQWVHPTAVKTTSVCLIVYLTTHSTHFISQLYGVGHMVKDYSDSVRGNLLPPLHGLLFSISSKSSFICTIPQTEHNSSGALAGTRNSSISPPWGTNQWCCGKFIGSWAGRYWVHMLVPAPTLRRFLKAQHFSFQYMAVTVS